VQVTAKAGNGGPSLRRSDHQGNFRGSERRSLGLDIPKQKMVLEEPIKAFGTYQIKAKLGYDVTGTVIAVVSEEA
jgi:large subunit ribosomal protein L9